MSELWTVTVTGPSGRQVTIGLPVANYHDALMMASYYEFPEFDEDDDQ